MKKHIKDLLWLLSGGVEETIKERNELKVQVGELKSKLQLAQERELVLQNKLLDSRSQFPLPLIMINALPKSGSSYIAESLRQGLNVPWKEICSGIFPHDVIDYRKLIEVSVGRTVSRAHLDAHLANLKLFKEFCPRIVLNLRDPRQALLSWIHFLYANLRAGHRHSFILVSNFPIDSMPEENLSAIIDWHLAHHLPNMLQWIDAWLAHAESGESPHVLITHYEDFLHNRETVVARILDYYQIPHDAYVAKEIPKNQATLFRKGQKDEWKDVFNPAQKQICAELIAGYPRINRIYAEPEFTENRPVRGLADFTISPSQNRQIASNSPMRS